MLTWDLQTGGQLICTDVGPDMETRNFEATLKYRQSTPLLREEKIHPYRMFLLAPTEALIKTVVYYTSMVRRPLEHFYQYI